MDAQFTTIAGADLYCQAHAGPGQPVLFVHGFPLCGEMWRPTVEQLGGRHRCFVPDLRGHGRSTATDSATIARFADDLAAVLDSYEESRPVVVVGLSLGGIIAFEFFRRHRARMRGLVLVCTRANAESPEGAARRETLARLALEHGSAPVAGTMIDNLFARVVDPGLRREWLDLMGRTDPRGIAATSRALATRPDSLATLKLIDVPTLVVAGDDDQITPVETLRQIHSGISGSRFEIVADAGHMVPVERPDRFAALLDEFLGSLAPN
jgi:pimeloyl-ACP methyl ester carboxylesterase